MICEFASPWHLEYISPFLPIADPLLIPGVLKSSSDPWTMIFVWSSPL